MKTALLVLAGLVVAGGILWAGITYPHAQVVAGTTAGGTFDTAKFAGIVMNLATVGANGTSSSILNNSGATRYVTGLRVGCNGVGTSQTAYTGAGLASLTLTVSTSSTATPGTLAEYAPVAHGFVVSTSTADFVMGSSTTQTATSTKAAAWHTGEYMTFAWNATNTAACTVGVDYLSS